MYPVYGLAEATLAVAFPAPGRPVQYDTVDRRRLALDGVAAPAPEDGESLTFVSVGQPLPRHRVEVVCRDTGAPLGERQVGELVVEGGSVTPRYFGQATSEARTRLRTGDLAYVADGHLYVVDRIKDLVIIAGQSYAPSDIESAAAAVTGLRRGRIVAFSSPGDGGMEELHIVAEASPGSWRLPQALEDDVRRKIRQDIGLSAASVTIVAPGSLERTSSGKIGRRACVEATRTGALRAMRTRSDVLVHRLTRGRDLLRHRAGQVKRSVLGWFGRVPAPGQLTRWAGWH
jgi:fatty-acyl-CoA synthase